MGWYIAVVVRGTFHEGELDSWAMGDRLFKLIEAADADGANAKAVALGESCRETFREDDGREVALQYLGLADLREISSPELTDGTEVYSEAITRRPLEHVQPREGLTVFAPWEVPEGDEEIEGSLQQPEEPGSERFRADPIREGD